MSGSPASGAVVIDTNWVLDLLVFQDPRSLGLLASLRSGHWRWLSCDPMRQELRRVLDYPAVSRRLKATGRCADEIDAQYLGMTEWHPLPPPCTVACADPDDQVFVDLAVCHRARLLSKDKEVLALRKRLLTLDSVVLSAWI